jgi:glutamyl endopeptidase
MQAFSPFSHLLALGCLAAALPLSTSAWAQHQSISDDGIMRMAPQAAGTVSASYAGTGRRPSRVPTESVAEYRALAKSKPKTAPVGIESVIGRDSRFRIVPTTSYPARAVALITFRDGPSSFICTGWFINRNTVATAGHCVNRGGGGGFYARTTYRVFPGRNGAGLPFGSCGARRLHTVVGWSVNGRDDYDYGAIKLNCNIGSAVGWFGYFWKSGTLNNLPASISGYPGDKPFGTLWMSNGRVTATQALRVFYKNDTIGGMSGSPVYYRRSASCNPCGMAVHAYGVYNGPPFSTNNHGTRITRSVFNNLTAWKNAP